MKGSKTMKENTNNKYAEFDTIVKEVTRELSSSVLIHHAKDTFETVAINYAYACVLDIFATIDINMPNEKLMDMMYKLRTFWAKLFVNDCFECDNKQSITSCIDRMFDIARDKMTNKTDDDKRFHEAISAVREELIKMTELDDLSGNDHDSYTKICEIIEYIIKELNHYYPRINDTMRYKIYILGSIRDTIIAAEQNGFSEYNRKLVISMIQTMLDIAFNDKSNNEEDK